MHQDKSLLFSLSFVSILALYNYDAMADKLICPAGKLVPVNGDRCIDCDEKNLLENMPENSSFEKIFCPGGLFDFGVDKIQGVYTCKNGKIADSDHKKCEEATEETRTVKARAPLLKTVNKKINNTSISNAINSASISSTLKNQQFDTVKDVVKNVNSVSRTYKCDAGQYLPASTASCAPCKDRYYCPGGTFSLADYNQGLKSCLFDTVPNKDKTACEKETNNKKYTCKAGQYLPSGWTSCTSCKDRYYCPGGTFSFADYNQGLKSCLFDTVPNKDKTACEKETIYNKKYSCSSGQYLPASTASCAPCKDRYYCTGGTFGFASYDQGLKSCPSGKVPNDSKTLCVKESSKTVSCSAGQYLKGTSCESCLDGYYCPGGKWAPEPSMNQGLMKCASGMIVNASKTACKKPDDIDCKAGYYIPAKAKSCSKCSGTKKYCPGVSGKPSDMDQGIYTCPEQSVPNSEKSACVLTLNKSMMQYGPGGNTVALGEQCWGKTQIDEYVKCMFGGKVVLPSSSSK